MPPRQQRTDNSRGKTRPKILANNDDFAWSLNITVPVTVDLIIANPPSGIVLVGLPQLIRSDNGQGPVTALWDGVKVAMSYADPIGPGVTFSLAQKDPALRGNVGQYLQAGDFTTPDAPVGAAVELNGDGATINLNITSVPDGPVVNWTVPDGDYTNVWWAVANPTALATGINLSGNVTPATVNAGEAFTYRWNGASWDGT